MVSVKTKHRGTVSVKTNLEKSTGKKHRGNTEGDGSFVLKVRY